MLREKEKKCAADWMFTEQGKRLQPALFQEHQSVSLELKPWNLSDEVRRFSSLLCILALRSWKCLKMSTSYANSVRHVQPTPTYSPIRNVLSSPFNSYSFTGRLCEASSYDVLLSAPRIESKSDKLWITWQYQRPLLCPVLPTSNSLINLLRSHFVRRWSAK